MAHMASPGAQWLYVFFPFLRRHILKLTLFIDVAFLAYFTTLSTLCSAVQQIHGILRWETVITEQFANLKENSGSPELVISNSAVGLDLVLYYIREFFSTSRYPEATIC